VGSSSSAAGREEGAGVGVAGPEGTHRAVLVLATLPEALLAAIGTVFRAFPTLARLGRLGTGVADSSSKPS
jgi:hypothetical protein